MEIDGIKVLQGLLSDFNLREVFNPSFLNYLDDEFEDAKIVNLGIVIGTEDGSQIINLAHVLPEDVEKNKLLIDISDSETMDKILDVIKTYKKRS